MTINAQLAEPQAPARFSGIPIRNLWYMLLYSWEKSAFINRWKVEIESAPTLDALLATILCKLLEQRLRIGLDRGYADESKTIRGVRGRVDFTESLKRLTFENGQAQCQYQTFTHNVPKNQIIRSSLARLVQTGSFGIDRGKSDAIKGKLRLLVRALDGVEFCEPSQDLIRRQTIGRNDADYQVMLNICSLMLLGGMPTEMEGRHSLPQIDKERIILSQVFEKFVACFYKTSLRGWEVRPQKTLDWNAEKSSTFMPSMKADVSLTEKTSGRKIVLDTKFTAASLISNRWGSEIFDSGHVYQIYAYLRSQEQLSESDRRASGILLYPTAGNTLDATVTLQGHTIYFKTVDLASDWQAIETRLLAIVSMPSRLS
jgi:5-methylcytosine-specific restriction enzyme subunit McrC